MARISLWLPPAVYMLAIFYLSSQPAPIPDVTERVSDKLLHGLAYAGLAALFSRALLGERFGPFATAAASALLASAYGATDEFHQAFVPLRSPDFGDWIMDTVGACMGALGYTAGTTWPSS